MKQIEEQELSLSLQTKINQLESLKKDYKNNKDYYVSYDNDSFKLKQINSLNKYP